MKSVVRNSVTGMPAAANSFGASGFFRTPSSMVRNATGRVTGIRDRNGTSSPGGRVIGSGGGAGGKRGTSLSFQPTGAPMPAGSVASPGDGDGDGGRTGPAVAGSPIAPGAA